MRIQVAYGGETSSNSAANLGPVSKRPVGAGQCVSREIGDKSTFKGALAP